MRYEEKKQIHDRANRIIESDLSWSEKYDMIFSDEVSMKFDFKWYDPDCDYEDDVMAFMIAFDEYMEKELIVFEQIDKAVL